MNSPRLLTDVEGDFTAQVWVGGTFQPGPKSTTTERVPFQAAGLLLIADDRTYLRLERAALYNKNGEVKHYGSWSFREAGQWTVRGVPNVAPLENLAANLRLVRRGDQLSGFVSLDGKKWTALPLIEAALPRRLKVGVSASTSASVEFRPEFADFTLDTAR